jgi:hypothetical protein
VDVYTPLSKKIHSARVMCDMGSHDWGSIHLPEFTTGELEVLANAANNVSGNFKWNLEDDIYWAVVGHINDDVDNPVVLGFLHPTESAMYFDTEKLERTVDGTPNQDISKGLTVRRYPNGLTFINDRYGNTEIQHPTGLKIKAGPDISFLDFTALAPDGGIAMKPATDPVGSINAVIRIEHPEFTFTVDAAGDITLNVGSNNIKIEGTGKAELEFPDVELGDGTLEKIVNGEAFQTLYNAHQHTETGGTTSAPTVAMGSGELSSKVKAGT